MNYSSARQGMLEDRKTYESEQEFLKRHFCRPVYREVITQAVLAGKLHIPDFFENKENYLYHNWIAPGMSWIDPQKTLAQICSQNGQDWREVATQRAEEINFMNNLNKKKGQKNDKETKE